MKDFFEKNRSDRRVMVVDDEMINRELLEAILSQNYEVTCAANGKEALEILKATDQPFSLILLDILMPEKSGIQTLAECKADEELKDIPIIVMTSEKSAEARSIKMGAADFISKPYRMPEVILARCERVIEHAEEKALIRSIEFDPATGLYIELFFKAYVKRLKSSKRPMDAVAVKLLCEDHVDYARKKTADLIRELLQGDGMACRTDDDVFYVYGPRIGDYDGILTQMRQALAEDPLSAGASVSLGVCAASQETDIDQLFDTAAERCR